MRASSRRSHHSVCASSGHVATAAPGCPVERSSSAASVNLPRRTLPLASIRSRAFSISVAGSPSVAPSLFAVVGPMCAIHPVTNMSNASSAEVGAVCSSKTCESKCAGGNNAANACPRSDASQYFRPFASATLTRFCRRS